MRCEREGWDVVLCKLLSGSGYRLRATRKLPKKPAEHGWNVAAFWIGLVMTMIALIMYGTMILKG